MTRGRRGIAGRLRQRARNRVAATTLLTFALIGLPLLFLSGAWAVDLVSVITTHAQVDSAATSAVLAGALEQQQDSAKLDRVDARTVTRQTFEHARSVGVMSRADIEQVRVWTSSDGRRVTLDVWFKVPGRAFSTWFDQSEQVLKLRQTAQTCSAGSRGITGGECARPRAG